MSEFFTHISYADIKDFLSFTGKFLMVVVTGIFGCPPLARGVGNLIEKWSTKKVSHIELADMKFGERIVQLEKVYAEHDQRMLTYTKRLDASDTASKALSDKLGTCQTQIEKTVTEIGSVNTEFKKNIEFMNVSLLERLEKDEGTILVHDSAIRNLLGSVKVKP